MNKYDNNCAYGGEYSGDDDDDDGRVMVMIMVIEKW